jgi:hypothetical protein
MCDWFTHTSNQREVVGPNPSGTGTLPGTGRSGPPWAPQTARWSGTPLGRHAPQSSASQGAPMDITSVSLSGVRVELSAEEVNERATSTPTPYARHQGHARPTGGGQGAGSPWAPPAASSPPRQRSPMCTIFLGCKPRNPRGKVLSCGRHGCDTLVCNFCMEQLSLSFPALSVYHMLGPDFRLCPACAQPASEPARATGLTRAVGVEEKEEEYAWNDGVGGPARWSAGAHR